MLLGHQWGLANRGQCSVGSRYPQVGLHQGSAGHDLDQVLDHSETCSGRLEIDPVPPVLLARPGIWTSEQVVLVTDLGLPVIERPGSWTDFLKLERLGRLVHPGRLVRLDHLGRPVRPAMRWSLRRMMTRRGWLSVYRLEQV